MNLLAVLLALVLRPFRSAWQVFWDGYDERLADYQRTQSWLHERPDSAYFRGYPVDPWVEDESAPATTTTSSITGGAKNLAAPGAAAATTPTSALGGENACGYPQRVTPNTCSH